MDIGLYTFGERTPHCTDGRAVSAQQRLQEILAAARLADQAGFADSLAYMKELKDAGAVFEPDEAKANEMFSGGEAAFIVTGPWMLGTFQEALGEDVGVETRRDVRRRRGLYR